MQIPSTAPRWRPVAPSSITTRPATAPARRGASAPPTRCGRGGGDGAEGSGGVIALRLQPPHATLATLRALPAAAQIEALTVSEIRLGRDDCAQLPDKFPNLCSLSLRACGLGDEVHFLARLPHLAALELTDDRALTDVGAARLGSLGALHCLPRLQRLCLDHTGLTDAGLARLEGLRALRYLSVQGTVVTYPQARKFALDRAGCDVVWDARRWRDLECGLELSCETYLFNHTTHALGRSQVVIPDTDA